MATAFIRTIVLYFLIMVGLRLLGKRQIGELEPIELVLTLLISDLAAVPMQDFGIPLLNGVIPIVTLLLLSMLLSWGSVRSIRLRRLICGSPTALILDGKVQQDAMRHNRFTLDELIEELRSQGVTDLTSVKYAVLETDGQLSVLLYPDEQPATPKQLGKPVKDDTFLPHIFINDGRVLGENLSLAGLDAAWLENRARAGLPRPVGDFSALARRRGQNSVHRKGQCQMKRFFWIPFCLLLALFGAALLNAAVADGLVTDWCAALDKLQDTAQAENWDSVRDDLSALHESWDAHATYFHITLQHDELNEVESLLARADSFAFEQDEGEFRACIAELKSQLLVLSEMQEISIQNIL